MKILLTANTSFKLANFREQLICELVKQGHELVAHVPIDAMTPKLEGLGCRIIPLEMDSKGKSIPHEAALLLRMWRVMRKERPDAVLGYTIKNNLYGALSARWLGIPFLPNVTGMGVIFETENFLSKLVTNLYRIAFKNSPAVFLQNLQDYSFFVEKRIASDDQARLLPGSGVDLIRFVPPAAFGEGSKLRILLVARLLRQKGIVEFVEAARIVKKKQSGVSFQILGPLDSVSKDGVPSEMLEQWSESGVIEYLGETSDVRPFIAAANCVVLPSYYREGTPRTLLEAAAMGKPIITTDMPGCRDVVDDGETGYLCQPRDHHDLAEKIEAFLGKNSAEQAEMGMRGRKKMEREFDEKLVIEEYLRALQKIAQ